MVPNHSVAASCLMLFLWQYRYPQYAAPLYMLIEIVML